MRGGFVILYGLGLFELILLESFVTICMSLLVLYPLLKTKGPDNAKKKFWICFWLRIILISITLWFLHKYAITDYGLLNVLIILITVCMSLLVLYPLIKRNSPDNTKKKFWKYFWLRIILASITLWFFPEFAIIDYWILNVLIFLIQKSNSLRDDLKKIVDYIIKNTDDGVIFFSILLCPLCVLVLFYFEGPNMLFTGLCIILAKGIRYFHHNIKIIMGKIYTFLKRSISIKNVLKTPFIVIDILVQIYCSGILILLIIFVFLVILDYSQFATIVDTYIDFPLFTNTFVCFTLLSIFALINDYVKNHLKREKNNTNNLDTFPMALDDYIKSRVDVENLTHPAICSIKGSARFNFSLITFLIISYLCIYHDNFIACGIIWLAILIIHIISIKRMTLLKYIKDKILENPEIDVDLTIDKISQELIKKRIRFSQFLLPLTLIICCMVFYYPHIFYDKGGSGYKVVIYTSGIINSNKVEIPDFYKGEKVVGIRKKAFKNLFFIEEIKLPKYLSQIEEETFKNTGLKSIIIPEGVFHIRAEAFYGCNNLKEIEIPKTMNYIDDLAFGKCNSIAIIKVSGNASIAKNAFEASVKVEYFSERRELRGRQLWERPSDSRDVH